MSFFASFLKPAGSLPSVPSDRLTLRDRPRRRRRKKKASPEETSFLASFSVPGHRGIGRSNDGCYNDAPTAVSPTEEGRQPRQGRPPLPPSPNPPLPLSACSYVSGRKEGSQPQSQSSLPRRYFFLAASSFVPLSGGGWRVERERKRRVGLTSRKVLHPGGGRESALFLSSLSVLDNTTRKSRPCIDPRWQRQQAAALHSSSHGLPSFLPSTLSFSFVLVGLFSQYETSKWEEEEKGEEGREGFDVRRCCFLRATYPGRVQPDTHARRTERQAGERGLVTMCMRACVRVWN